MEQVLKTANPDDLLNSTFSIEIYGCEVSKDFVDSVRKYGVQVPITVAADEQQIVSGHRRNCAARICKLKDVPVFVRSDLVTPLQIKRAIIESNNQRERTAEILAREFKAQEIVLREELSARGEKASQTEIDSKVAEVSKVSREQVRRGRKVSAAIESAKKAGDIQKADKISSAKTIGEAYKVVTECPKGGEHEYDNDACIKCHEPQSARKKTAARGCSKEFSAFEDGYSRMVRGLDSAAETKGHGAKSRLAGCMAVARLLYELVTAWDEGRSPSDKELTKCLNCIRPRFTVEF